MKVLMINVVCGIRSTGRICTDLANALEKQGHEVKIAYGRENVPERFQKYAIRIGSDFDIKTHAVKARLFDAAGFGSRNATKKFIKWIKEWNPDVIHLHNLHGYYINIEVLFNYLRTCNKKIIWTLHDCWSFTGHCCYFDYAGCDKWKERCYQCPQEKEYPTSWLFKRAKLNYEKKKTLFSNIPNMQLVTPSKWLADLVKQSYMKSYPVSVINNGIDTDVFKPTKSNLRDLYKIEEQKLILGVASVWDKRKGLDTLTKLAKETDYIIVVIGVTESQKESLPENMIGILRTNSVKELVQWYSVADVFVNSTREDNYPTTNLEAIACGTPVFTFETGGSPESAENYGLSVKNYEDLKKALKKLFDNEIKLNQKNRLISVTAMVDEYMEIYKAEDSKNVNQKRI